MREESGESGVHGEECVCRERREREGVRERDWDSEGVEGVRGEKTEEEVGGIWGEEMEEGEGCRGEGRAGRAWEEATGDRLGTTK